jgi:ribosome-associated protein
VPASDPGDAQPPAAIDPRDLTVRVDTAGGPGGQHANRTRSRVTIELDLRTASLDETTRERLRTVFGDVVRATSSASRRQGENRRLAEERLLRRVATALDEPAPRRPTAPTRAAEERRLAAKRRRAALKRLRSDADDE